MNENNFEDVIITTGNDLFSLLNESFKQLSEILTQIVEKVFASLSDIVAEIVDCYELEKPPRPQYKTFDKSFTKAYVMQPIKRGLGYRKKAR